MISSFFLSLKSGSFSSRLLLVVFFLLINQQEPKAETTSGTLKLQLPSDIQINFFAKEVLRARHMAFDDQGILFLSQAKEGKVVALPDQDKNGEADRTVVILRNRRNPHGLAFTKLVDGYYLYIAEETRVIRLKRLEKPFRFGKPETIIDNIPDGGHYTRTIKIKNNQLYLSVGSSCNV